MWQGTWSPSISFVLNEKGAGSLSPACSSQREKSTLSFATRAGVPVLSLPRSIPREAICSASRHEGGSPSRPPGKLSSPMCMSPLGKVPSVRMTFGARKRFPPAVSTPSTAPFLARTRRRLGLEESDIAGALDRPEHPPVVCLLVRLGPGGPYGGAFCPVQHPELYSALVDREPHLAAKRVHFPDELPLGEPAYRRIARHPGDMVPAHRDEQRRPPHPARRERSLAAGVAGPHDDDIEVDTSRY